jgi:hypothetical protein
MDAVDGAGRWIGHEVAKARERERIRVEDRLTKLDQLDEAAREFVRHLRHHPGKAWEMEADGWRVRMIGLGLVIDDGKVEQLIRTLSAEAQPTDEAYIALASRLAALRTATLAEE